SPPRAATVAAGSVAFAVQVTSAEDDQFSQVEEGTVQVGGFSALSVKVVPRTSQGKRTAKHRVEITNSGNAPLHVTLDALDPDALLAFDFSPRTVEVPGGGETVAGLRVVSSTAAKGSPKRHSFTVTAESGGTTAASDAAFEQKPRGSILIWVAVAVVAAVLVVLLRDTADAAELGVQIVLGAMAAAVPAAVP
ncbi:MAG TPA: hypothetical protein VFV35_00220, partial [Acidimicrobiales bacterium]|nr:hypothetical protein [Acidimicrobiales bacterium]